MEQETQASRSHWLCPGQVSPTPPGLGDTSWSSPHPWFPPGAACTSWDVCCSAASSWILISGHAGSPDLPASGWGDREGPGERGRREPPHWLRGGTREMGMDGQLALVLPNPAKRLPQAISS